MTLWGSKNLPNARSAEGSMSMEAQKSSKCLFCRGFGEFESPKHHFWPLLSSESSLLRHFCDSCLLMFSTVGGQKGSKSDALEEHQKRVEKVNICQKWPKRAQKGPEGVHKGYRFCHFGSLFIVKVTPLVKAVTKGSKLSKMGPKRVQKGPKRVPPRPPFWRS